MNDHIVDIGSHPIDDLQESSNMTDVDKEKIGSKEVKSLERGILSWHVSLISLGGIIGSCYFLGLGLTFSEMGPVAVLIALSVNSMAFNCHLNLFSTLEHLNHCTRKRAHQLCAITVGISFLLYNCFGLFSYLDLFDKIGAGSSLEFYPRVNWLTKFTIVGVVIVLIVSSPLVIWAARISFINLIWKDKPASNFKWVMTGGTLLLLAAFLASSSEDVIFFFDIVGGFLTPTIEFVFPVLFFLKIQRGAPKWKIVVACINLFFSVVSITACLYQAIRQIVEAASGKSE